MTKKKGAVYSVVALMLCMAVYLNWSYNRGTSEEGFETMEEFETSKMLGEAALVDGDASGEVEQTADNTSGIANDYFSEARLSRQQARDEAVSILNTTVKNEAAGEEAVQQANAEIQVMAQSAMQESRIENRIIAKGYKDCVVFASNGSINVIISKLENGLQDSDVARITEIVIEETGVDPANITIIETT